MYTELYASICALKQQEITANRGKKNELLSYRIDADELGSV